MSDLPPGLYERLITTALEARLLKFDAARVTVGRTGVDPAEAHRVFGQHIGESVAHALRSLPAAERLERQRELTDRLMELLGNRDDTIPSPPEVLQSIQPVTGIPADDAPIVSPLVPLSDSDLLVNARGEPALAHALANEIPSADSIDLLCAFVRWHGIRVLDAQLREHCRKGRPLRVITTVYTGSTENRTR